MDDSSPEPVGGARVRRRVGGALVLLAACAPAADDARLADGPPSAPAHPPVATSVGGMVVSGSAYATEAGVRMLEAGGNAVDAAVAAAFALAVAEPTQSGLGGRTQILLRSADGAVHGIDGTTQVPAGYDAAAAPRGEHGHGAVAIPGTVAALARAVEEHGSLDLATVVAPARAWALDGILLPEGEAGRIATIAPQLDPDSELARIFLRADGGAPEAGSRIHQPDLARLLEQIGREGATAFYRGRVARRIAEDMAAHGAFVTEADLASYRAVDSEIGRGAFDGAELIGSYLPASGVTVIEIMQILDALPLGSDGMARRHGTLVAALLAGFDDRASAEGTPADEAVAWLTSDSLALRRAWEGLARVESARPAREDAEAPFTTHVSVADTFGNVVALTQSLGPTLGARVVTPGLGFVYASTLGGYLEQGAPGDRPWSSQAPLIAVRDGRPVLVMGGAGARRILSAMVGTLLHVFEDGQSLEEAMAQPRLHPTGGMVLVEEGWPGAAGLANLGFAIEPRERTYFARLNAVEILPDGTFRGVGEPRWPESAAGGPRQ